MATILLRRRTFGRMAIVLAGMAQLSTGCLGILLTVAFNPHVTSNYLLPVINDVSKKGIGHVREVNNLSTKEKSQWRNTFSQ